MGFYRFVFTLVLRSESKVDTHIYIDGCTADRSVVCRFVFTHGKAVRIRAGGFSMCEEDVSLYGQYGKCRFLRVLEAGEGNDSADGMFSF